jgi:methyl-accepting chemotaxis protein
MKIKNTSLFTALLLALLFCAVNLLLLNKFHKEKIQAEKNHVSITATSIMNKATIELSLERSVTQATLSLDTPIADSFKSLLLSQRKKSEQGFDEAVELVSSSDIIDRKDEFLSSLTKLRSKINEIRKIADEELKIFKENRNQKNITQLPDMMKDSIMSFSNLSLKLIPEDSYIPPFVNKLNYIQSLAWSIREFGGRERTYLAVATATGEKISDDLLMKMSNYHKKAKDAMSRLQVIADSSNIYGDVKEKIEGLEKVYFNEYKKIREAIINASNNNQPYPYDFTQFFTDSTNALNEAVELSILAGDEMEQYVSEQRTNSVTMFWLFTGVLVFALCISFFQIYYLRIKVSKRIDSVSDLMEKLSNNDTDINIKVTDSKDEINDMLKSLNVLKNAVSENLLLQKMTSDYPVIRCDKDFKITFVNEAADKELKKLSLSKDDLIDNDLSQLSSELSENKSQYRDSKNLPKKERIMVGDEWVDVNVNYIESETGFDGIYMNIINVTELVHNEENIKKAQFEIQNLIDAAYNGDLKNRIDSDKFEGFYKDLANSLNGLMDAIVKPIDISIETLKSLANGDLTASMDGNFNGSFADIQESLNNTIDNLKDMVAKIIDAARAVSASAFEISSGSADLSQRTEQQASNLEETSASMEQMTASVQENTKSAVEAGNLANDTKNAATEGSKAVGNTVDSMISIEESSKKISEIVTVIDEIAFQTNLLALNAAVEAARAGDAGKGFAVVADEVRALAGRSANSSKEIKDLITESVEKIKNGVDIAKQSGENIENINESINSLATLVTNISEASKEQNSGIGEVNSAINQLDQMTQQNAAMVEENTAAAESMTQQANNLQEMMKFFKLDNNVKNNSATILSESNNNIRAEQGDNDVQSIEDNSSKKSPSSDDGWEKF